MPFNTVQFGKIDVFVDPDLRLVQHCNGTYGGWDAAGVSPVFPASFWQGPKTFPVPVAQLPPNQRVENMINYCRWCTNPQSQRTVQFESVTGTNGKLDPTGVSPITIKGEKLRQDIAANRECADPPVSEGRLVGATASKMKGFPQSQTTQDRSIRCYICGCYYSDPDEREWRGAECEHIVPFFCLLLCVGINNQAHYISMADSWWNINGPHVIARKPNFNKATYDSIRNEIWKGSYRWSCWPCNQLKNEYPYVNICRAVGGSNCFLLDLTSGLNTVGTRSRPPAPNPPTDAILRSWCEKYGISDNLVNHLISLLINERLSTTGNEKYSSLWRYQYRAAVYYQTMQYLVDAIGNGDGTQPAFPGTHNQSTLRKLFDDLMASNPDNVTYVGTAELNAYWINKRLNETKTNMSDCVYNFAKYKGYVYSYGAAGGASVNYNKFASGNVTLDGNNIELDGEIFSQLVVILAKNFMQRKNKAVDTASCIALLVNDIKQNYFNAANLVDVGGGGKIEQVGGPRPPGEPPSSPADYVIKIIKGEVDKLEDMLRRDADQQPLSIEMAGNLIGECNLAIFDTLKDIETIYTTVKSVNPVVAPPAKVDPEPMVDPEPIVGETSPALGKWGERRFKQGIDPEVSRRTREKTRISVRKEKRDAALRTKRQAQLGIQPSAPPPGALFAPRTVGVYGGGSKSDAMDVLQIGGAYEAFVREVSNIYESLKTHINATITYLLYLNSGDTGIDNNELEEAINNYKENSYYKWVSTFLEGIPSYSDLISLLEQVKETESNFAPTPVLPDTQNQQYPIYNLISELFIDDITPIFDTNGRPGVPPAREMEYYQVVVRGAAIRRKRVKYNGILDGWWRTYQDIEMRATTQEIGYYDWWMIGYAANKFFSQEDEKNEEDWYVQFGKDIREPQTRTDAGENYIKFQIYMYFITNIYYNFWIILNLIHELYVDLSAGLSEAAAALENLSPIFAGDDTDSTWIHNWCVRLVQVWSPQKPWNENTCKEIWEKIVDNPEVLEKWRSYVRSFRDQQPGRSNDLITLNEVPEEEMGEEEDLWLGGGGKILINNKRISKKQQEKTIINYLKTNKSSIKSLKDKNRKLKKTNRKKLNKKYKIINKSKRINRIKTKRINKRINKRNKKNKK